MHNACSVTMGFMIYIRLSVLLWGILYTCSILCYYGVYCIYKTCCVTTGYIIYIRHVVLPWSILYT